MSSSELNKKTWYRAGKVLFVFAFLFAQVIVLALVSSLAVETRAQYHCKGDGETIYDGRIFDLATDLKERLVETCKAKIEAQGVEMFTDEEISFLGRDFVIGKEFDLRVDSRRVPKHSMSVQATYFVGTFIAVLFIFFVFARILRYIFTGKRLV